MDLQQLVHHLQTKGLPRPTLTSITIYALFVIYSVIACIVIPGKRVYGVQLRDKSRILYKMNGLRMLTVGIILFLAGSYFGLYPAEILIDHFGELLITALVFSVVASLFLYFRALWWIPKVIRVL